MKTIKFSTLLILLIIMNVMTAATIAYGRAPSVATRSFITQASLDDCLKFALSTLKAGKYTDNTGNGPIYVWGSKGDYMALIKAWDISNDQYLVVITVAGPGEQSTTCINEVEQLQNTMKNNMSNQQSSAEGADSNKEACLAWCKENSTCAKCSFVRGCGPGYQSMKEFAGRGKNWFACQKR